MTKYYVYHVSYVYKKRWKYHFAYESYKYKQNITEDQVAVIQDILETKHKSNNVVILNIMKLEE